MEDAVAVRSRSPETQDARAPTVTP